MSYPKVYRDIFENEGAGPLFRSDRIPTIKANGIADGSVTPAKLSQSYLPTTGGAITGAGSKIQFDNASIVVTATDTVNEFCVEANGGGRLLLRSASSGVDPGVFYLIADGAAGEKVFSGSSSGNLYWDGGRIVPLTDSWRSGESWYRMYADGWIEQGGLELDIPNNSIRTISLFKPYRSSAYMALGVLQWTAGIYTNHAACAQRASSFVELANYRSAGSGTWTINAYWYTCGYGY